MAIQKLIHPSSKMWDISCYIRKSMKYDSIEYCNSITVNDTSLCCEFLAVAVEQLRWLNHSSSL